QVHSVTTGGVVIARITFPEPSDKFHHNGVAPHPGWKTPEIAQSLLRALHLLAPCNKSVNPKCIRPIRFQRDCAKTFLCDQSPGQVLAGSIELMGAVRSFADENALCASCHFHQRIAVSRLIDVARR